jgi:RNA methyltransferase, TrmH family
VITSRDNERLKLVRKLHDRRWRDKLGLFFTESEDLLGAAHAAGVEPVDVLVAGETVEPRLLADVSTLGHPPRVVAVFRRSDLPRADPAGDSPWTGPDGARLPGLALWHVSDPGNVGTLLRAADALGPARVALSPGSADPTGPKALRASAGAIFRVPLGDFDAAPGPRVGLVARGGQPLSELELAAPVTFVLGAEREGLPADVAARCDQLATIPQAPTAESLNVAMAGTVALYELSRRRSAARAS